MTVTRAGSLSVALAEEFAAVTGDTCGHECAAHSEGRVRGDAPHALVCQRAKGHAGAILAADQHAGQDEHGAPVVWTCACGDRDGQ